jgi:hypothetical protein
MLKYLLFSAVAGGGDSWITEAAAALDQYEKDFASDGSADKAKAIVEGMQTSVYGKLTRSNEKTSPAWAAAAGRYNKLREACVAAVNSGSLSLSSMDQTNLNKIRGNLDSWTAELNGLGNKELSNATEQDRWIRNVGSLNGLFGNIQNQKHPDVQASFQVFKGFVDTVNGKINAARETLAGAQARYADADKRAADIFEVYSDISPLRLPAEREVVEEWIARTIAQMDYLTRAQETLKDFSVNAPNPAPFTAPERYYRVDMPEKLKRMVDESNGQFDWRLTHMQQTIDYVRDTDIKNESHVSNRLKPDQVAEKLQEIRLLIAEAEALIPYETKLLKQSGERLKALKGSLEAAARVYSQKGEAAVASVRMPDDTGNPELARTAGDILTARGFGPVKRFVINYDIHEKDSKRTVIEGEWLVTYRLHWKEFQAATAEQEGDSFYLFYNDFCNYDAGDPSTTLNKWLHTGRFRGQKILEENIGK